MNSLYSISRVFSTDKIASVNEPSKNCFAVERQYDIPHFRLIRVYNVCDLKQLYPTEGGE